MKVVQALSSWRALFVVVLSALATFLAADLALRRVAPPVLLREVEDAVRDYEDSDPTVLCIGSSHARSFDVLGRELAVRTGGRERLLAVPVEWGKLSSYEWVLQNRFLPLLEERDRDGGPRRPSLRRFLLVTEWWDSTLPPDGSRAANLPARAWTWRHFLASVRDEGLNAYNANYLANRWRRIWSGSSLVADRGHGRILAGLRDLVRPLPSAARERRFQAEAALWRRKIEDAENRILAAEEMAAMTRILDSFASLGIETTVVLYPRMPITVSDHARTTTLAAFSTAIAQVCAERDLRFVDLTTWHPLTDADYAEDFDHVLPDGNQRFSRWALDGPLAFLATPPTENLARGRSPTASPPGQGLPGLAMPPGTKVGS